MANLPGDHQAANARALERLDVLRVLYERVNLASGDAVESVDPTELSELVAMKDYWLVLILH